MNAEDGLKTLVAKADAGDVTWFMAAVNRIADILRARGDTDVVGVRRAKAVGILARPAEALHLLAEHRSDRDPADPGDSPQHPDQAPPTDLDLLDSLLDDLDPDGPDGPDGPDDPKPEAGPAEAEPPADDPEAPEAVAEDTHRSLAVGWPFGPRDLRRARPRMVLYFHLAEAAIRDGHGWSGPSTATRSP